MILPKVSLMHNRRGTGSPAKRAAVEICISYRNKRKILATGVLVCTTQWDKRRGLVKARPDAQELNRLLAAQRQKVMDIILGMGEYIDLNELGILAGNGEKPAGVTFVDYIRGRIEHRAVDDGTRRRYQTWLKYFEQWGGMIFFHQITARNINAFGEWVAARKHADGRKFAQGTVYNYHAALRSFINDAVRDEYIRANPYNVKRIKVDKGAKRHVDTLSPEQVAKTEALDLSEVPYMERARDCFLFQCYTGMCYADLAKFRLSDCKEMDGELIMRANRQKTDTEYMFMLLPKARAIAERYGGRLPLVSNQKYNQFLKAIGQMIGERNLHSHMGRASCATIMRNAGLPMSVIQKVLGHTTLAQTERYASLMDSTVIEEMRRLK